MGRKREPRYDWVCRRCECPCTPPSADLKHVGGGQGMRACRRQPVPVLRRDLEAEFAEAAADALAAMREREPMYRRG